MADLNLSVIQTSTITENVSYSMLTELFPNVFDAIAVSEQAYLVINQSNLSVSVNDMVAVTEDKTVTNGIAQITTYYVDPVNGNDANAGTSWATARKNLTNANVGNVAGALIKIAKTSDPALIGEAQFHSGQHFGGLSPQGAEKILLCPSTGEVVKDISDCETEWSPAPSVTVTSDTDRVEGSFSQKFVIGAGHTTGKVAHSKINPQRPQVLDLSAYTRLSFYMKNPLTADVAGGVLKVCLCSDYDGDFVVDEFVTDVGLGGNNTVNPWIPFDLARTGGGALGASIKSVAVYVVTDIGAQTVHIDNIFAHSGLGLRSLVGQNGNNGDDVWYSILSIKNKEIKLGSVLSGGIPYQSMIGRRHVGSAQLYYRNTANLYSMSITNDNFKPSFQGIYEGGWNTSSPTRDGETYLDGLSATNGAVNPTANLISFRNLSVVRTLNGMLASSQNLTVDNCHMIAIATVPLSGTQGSSYRKMRCVGSGGSISLGGGNYLDDVWSIGSRQSGITSGAGAVDCYLRNCKILGSSGECQPAGSDFVFDNCIFANTGQNGISFGPTHDFLFRNCTVEYNNARGVYFALCSNIKFVECNFNNNGVADILNNGQDGCSFIDCTFSSTTFIEAFASTIPSKKLTFQGLNGDKSDKRIYKGGGTILSDIVNFRTASPCFSMSSNAGSNITEAGLLTGNEDGLVRGNRQYLTLDGFKAPKNLGVDRTLNIYLKRESGFAGTVKLGVRSNGKTVIQPEAVTVTTGYQLFSVTVPASFATDNGIYELVVLAHHFTTDKVFVDDFSWT